MDIRNFKDNAKTAAAYLAEHGIDVSHTRLLEALSRAFGERNWSTLHAQLGKLKDSPQGAPKAADAVDWEPSQGPMTEAQYVRYGGNRCPFCGSSELEAGDVEADGAEAWDRTDCMSCCSSWSSAFKLSGYFNARKGDGAPEPEGPVPADKGSIGHLLAALTDKQGIVLTMLSDDREDWLGHVFRAKEALPVLAQQLDDTQVPNSVEDILTYVSADMGSAVERLLAARVRPVYTSAKFDEPSAREDATNMATSVLGLTLIESLREDVVEDIVGDVRERARKYGFSFSGARRAEELARESAELLGLDATEAELFEAACRLA